MWNFEPHDTLTDHIREQLSLYVLRLLPEAESVAIEDHVESGCAVCELEIIALEHCLAVVAETAAPHEPPPGLRQRILSTAGQNGSSPQVWKNWHETPPVDLLVVRDGEGDWQRVCQGVSVRRLYVDRERDSVTMLIRMEPGSAYKPHRHGGPEQCLVLEGDLFDGVQEFRAGDFQVASANTVHGVQSTRNGCLLFIISSLHDELLT